MSLSVSELATQLVLDAQSPLKAVSSSRNYFPQYDAERIGFLRRFVRSNQGDIAERASSLMPHSIVELRSDDDDNRYFLTNTSFVWAFAEVGRGASSTVYRARIYPLSGDPVTDRVVKVSRDRLVKQATMLADELSPDSKVSRELDQFLGAYELGRYNVAICLAADSDLSHLDHTKRRIPATRIIHDLEHAVGGMASLHRRDLLHRDMKGPNVLITNGREACATDWGLVRKLCKKLHRTAVTPNYAAPFIWSDVNAQFERIGLQTKAADAYAVGRMIHRDVLFPLIRQFSKKLGFSKKIAWERLLAKRVRSDSEDGTLEALTRAEKSCPGRVICSPGSGDYPSSGCIFPDRDDQLAAILEVIDYLGSLENEQLPPSECEKLRGLARLAHGLIADSRAGVCEFLGVVPDDENKGDLLAQALIGRLESIQAGRDGTQCSCRKKLALDEEKLFNVKEERVERKTRTRENLQDNDSASLLPSDSPQAKKRVKKEIK